MRVKPGGPAAQVGLKGARIGGRNTIYTGDVIVALDEKDVDSVARLLALLDDHKAGDVVQVTVWREGKKIRVPITLRSAEDDN